MFFLSLPFLPPPPFLCSSISRLSLLSFSLVSLLVFCSGYFISYFSVFPFCPFSLYCTFTKPFACHSFLFFCLPTLYLFTYSLPSFPCYSILFSLSSFSLTFSVCFPSLISFTSLCCLSLLFHTFPSRISFFFPSHSLISYLFPLKILYPAFAFSPSLLPPPTFSFVHYPRGPSLSPFSPHFYLPLSLLSPPSPSFLSTSSLSPSSSLSIFSFCPLSFL